MLMVPGDRNLPAYNEYLEDLLSRSTAQETQDGFVYYVAPPEEPMGLGTGKSFRDPEQTDLTLVVNGNLFPENREKIAQVAVAGEVHLDHGRYHLAKAIDEILSYTDDDSFFNNIQAINMLFEELQIDRKALRSNQQIDNETRAFVDKIASSAIGTLATKRGISDDAVDARNRLLDLGLVLPDTEVKDTELNGFLRTKAGTVKASFKHMKEKSERHTCAHCSSQIIQGSSRVTLGLEKNDGYSDHHHYHMPCFDSYVLPRFDFKTFRRQQAKYG